MVAISQVYLTDGQRELDFFSWFSEFPIFKALVKNACLAANTVYFPASSFFVQKISGHAVYYHLDTIKSDSVLHTCLEFSGFSL